VKDPILAIFMRTDLNMSRGKIAVQAGHAVSMSIIQPFSGNVWSHVEEWLENQQIKIVLAVNSLEDLEKIVEIAKKNKILCRRIYDAGKTEVSPGTVTCVAVGIESRRRINKITKGWKALK